MGGTQTPGNLVVGSIEASVQSWFVQLLLLGITASPPGLVVPVTTFKFIFKAGTMMPRY